MFLRRFGFRGRGSAAATLSGPLRFDAPLFCEFGESFNTVANFFSRQAQFIKLLKIEPKFRAGAKPVSEPQRGIGRYRSLAVNDNGNYYAGAYARPYWSLKRTMSSSPR